MRATPLLIATLTLLTAGCIGIGEDLDPAQTDTLNQTTQTLDYSGALASEETQTHDLQITPDTVRFNITLTDTHDDLTLSIQDPNGDTIQTATPGETLHILGVHIDAHGTGTYQLTITNNEPLNDATYQLQGTITTGNIPPPTQLQPVPNDTPTEPGVTVALIDTGLNVYHETFQRNPQGMPNAIDQTTNQPAKSVPLTHLDDKQNALTQDDPTWRALEYETLYKFEGTNAYGISFVPDTITNHYRPIQDASFHGTAVADRVLEEEPNATIIMVEVSATSWEEIARAIEWTSQQDWIDITSMSMGNPANLPNPLIAGGDPNNDVPRHAHQLVQNGGTFITSAGNDPTLAWTDNAGGPPWMITVSGAEPTINGQNIIPANGPDFVANFTAHAASDTGTDTYTWAAGTSFSAPHLAGSMAHTLLQLREHTNTTITNERGPLIDTPELTLTTHDLRDAFNQTAHYWDTTDYDPTNPPGDDTGTQAIATSAPITPTPWVQKGWGYVNATIAQTTTEHILGINQADEKPAPAQAHMEGQHELRWAYWNAQME